MSQEGVVRKVVECRCLGDFHMAGKNVGITLLCVVVAIGAFIAGNIWTTSLHDNVERITHATEAWSTAYNAVNDKEIDLRGNAPADQAGIAARLKHRIEDAHQLDDATLKLMQVGAGNLADDEASITITKKLHTTGLVLFVTKIANASEPFAEASGEGCRGGRLLCPI